MSSIMRARSGLTGRFEDWEVIGGSSLKPKVAGPSMLGIGCPNRHAFLFTRSPTPPENPPTSTPPSRESGFVRCPKPDRPPASARYPRGVVSGPSAPWQDRLPAPRHDGA